MPCYDPRDREDDAHNSKAAELLCALLRYTTDEERRAIPDLPGLRDWWVAHQARDSYKAGSPR